MTVRHFKSATALKAAANLRAFISTARAADPFNAQWDDQIWVTAKKSRASRRGSEALRFWRHQHIAPDRGSFAEPFASFVRAMVCHREAIVAGGLAITRHDDMIRACRYLYEILLPRATLANSENGEAIIVDPISLVYGDFDAAQVAARMRESVGAANNVSSALGIAAKTIDRRGLTLVPLQWRRTLTRRDKYNRVGEEAEQQRHQKMPTDETFEALADISNRSDISDRDLLRQRAVELLMCGGFRINEMLTLPRNTWLSEAVLDERGEPMLDRFGKALMRYGIRYWPEKGGASDTQVKWLPTIMADVALRAVNDIIRITAPYARAACFAAANPGRAFLGDPYDEMPADHLLTTSEAAKMLGLGGQGSMYYFLQLHRVPTFIRPRRVGRGRAWSVVRKGDLERVLVERLVGTNKILPSGEADVALHQCLFVVPLEFFHPKNGNLCGTALLVNDGQINAYLCGNSATQSIFERLKMTGSDGHPLRMNSHQFRHWLNTLAQEGGLSEAEIARWMGRRSLAQNASYDHVPPAKLAKRLREKLRKGEAAGPVADRIRRIKDPVRREEFIRTVAPTAHATDLGGCLHDWSSLPCDKHGSCADCDKHWFEKGDFAKRSNAEALRDDTRRLLEQARVEAADGTYGVDNWLVHHERILVRVEAMLAIHNDLTIPDGTLVRLRRDGRVEWNTEEGADAAGS